jgi:hypothetical protein
VIEISDIMMRYYDKSARKRVTLSQLQNLNNSIFGGVKIGGKTDPLEKQA